MLIKKIKILYTSTRKVQKRCSANAQSQIRCLLSSTPLYRSYSNVFKMFFWGLILTFGLYD